MLQLNNLTPTNKKRKRVGRGGSRGGTAGRGHKGQKARSGSNSLKPFFEGGQMPLPRRLPRRGFTNAFAVECRIIDLDVLEAKFEVGQDVTREALVSKNIIKGKGKYIVKVLGSGKLTKALNVHVDKFSKSAMKAIQDAGGKAVLSKESGSDSTAS